jgi:DGQHR domain-containing protein
MATATKARSTRTRRKPAKKVLRLPAIEIKQGKNRKLYSFAVDGKLLPDFCTISRVSRHEGEDLEGYQRPEVVSHISQIREYLESDDPLLPNAIVVAFDKSVRFKPSGRAAEGLPRYSRAGVLEIPIDPMISDELKPGWIVDGQQRSAALRDARVSKFPVCVVGFVADGLEEQRQQFILVNATKPLPKGLIYELLPSTEGKLPLALQRRKHPALLSERLNFDEDSPLKGRIRTPTNGTGLVADNSVLKMLENSLTDGVLYCHEDVEDQLNVLKVYWSAVAELFPEPWALLPRLSRLTHGAGFISMGFLMDTIADRHGETKTLTKQLFKKELAPLVGICHWTDGTWEFSDGNKLKWNEVQNVPRHIQLLANHLLLQYRDRVWKA